MSAQELDTRKWGYSVDGGESYDGRFDSRAEAIDAAYIAAELEPGESREIHICRCDEQDFSECLIRAIRASDIIENADELASEDFAVEHEVFTQGVGAVQELESGLRLAAQAWLAVYPCKRWYHADQVEAVIVSRSGVETKTR